MIESYSGNEPARVEVEAWRGPVLLEFGADWCGFCQRAQPLVKEALASFPGTAHRKVEDGPGRPLGRSYRVKQWPTLIFLRDGCEQARLVRPQTAAEIVQALRGIVSAS